jgi:hypothetical protein
MEQTFSENILLERGRSHGNFVLAVIAGTVVALVGAVVWLCVGLATGWQVGPLALPLGLAVGWSIGASGRGTHFVYGVMGIIFTGLACLAGQILLAIVMATTSNLDLFSVIDHLQIDQLIVAIIGQISPMMAAIYAVSAFVAYKLSFRKNE